MVNPRRHETKNFSLEKKKETFLEVKVIPNSSNNQLIKIEGHTATIKVASPPYNGKANKQCLSFLTKNLKIPKSGVQIIKGFKSRKKLLKISSTHDDILRKLKELL